VSAGARPDRLGVERSGGFGGLTLRASVALDELTPAERAALEEALAPQQPPPAPGPDRFVYRFQLGGREATVQDGQVPAGLRPLLRRLSGHWT